MLIDIPVLIAFDCDPKLTTRHRDVAHCAGQRVFTMRYDTEDTDRAAQWCLQYPPPANAHWIEDTQGVLFDLLASGTDKVISKRAADDPETYDAVERPR